MRIDHAIFDSRSRTVLVCLFFNFVCTAQLFAQSQVAKAGHPIKQTYRMIVPASFSTVGPTPVVFANLESSEQPLQFQPQQWTIRSRSSRGLNVTISLEQPMLVQTLGQAERSPETRLPNAHFKAVLRTTKHTSFGGRPFQSSIQSNGQLDHAKMEWQTGTSGAGLFRISVSPSIIFVDGLSEHDSQIHSQKTSLATITSEVTESP